MPSLDSSEKFGSGRLSCARLIIRAGTFAFAASFRLRPASSAVAPSRPAWANVSTLPTPQAPTVRLRHAEPAPSLLRACCQGVARGLLGCRQPVVTVGLRWSYGGVTVELRWESGVFRSLPPTSAARARAKASPVSASCIARRTLLDTAAIVLFSWGLLCPHACFDCWLRLCGFAARGGIGEARSRGLWPAPKHGRRG